MRTPGLPRGARHAVALLAAAAMLALTGCAGSGDAAPTDTAAQETSTAAPTPAPTELTEAEALDIAVTTYEQYLTATGEVLVSGDDATSRFNEVVTEEFGSPQLETLLDRSETEDLVVEGEILVVKAELQKLTADSIDVYLCTDASNAVVYQAGETPETSRDQTIYPLEVRLIRIDNTFKIDQSETWDNSDFCSGL